MDYLVNGEVVRAEGCLFRGSVNDVLVADKAGSKNGQNNRYVILKIKDNETARLLVKILKEYREKLFVTFCVGRNYCILAPYMKGRKINAYIYAAAKSLEETLTICRDIVDMTASSGIPYDILYLMLRERKINIDEKGKIYFSYDLDLYSLEEGKTEKDCARECGYIIEELLKDKKYSKLIIVKLIKKKNSHDGYKSFRELTGDIENTQLREKAFGRLKKIRTFIKKHERFIVRLLIIISIAAICIAAAMILSELMDINGSIDIIGTENLAEP